MSAHSSSLPLTAPAVAACGLVLCLSLGTNSGVMLDISRESNRFATGWTASVPAPAHQIVVPPVVTPAAEVLATSASLLERIHEGSGLTWEQIAKIFNVSRRSVHLWLSGGRMSAANEERLIALERFVFSIQADPATRRHQILASTDAGPSFFDSMRRDQASGADDINRNVEPRVIAE